VLSGLEKEVAKTDNPDGAFMARVTYKAFISYSHKADSAVAAALQKALRQFARPWYKVRAMRVFRDQTNLALSDRLRSSIEQALDESEYFILLASLQAAQSQWVRREVAHWLSTKSPGTLMIVLTSGEIVWDDAAQDFDWNRTTALPPDLREFSMKNRSTRTSATPARLPTYRCAIRNS
jgi:hypothetical protein